MRRILRKIVSNEMDIGDVSTLLNPKVVQRIIDNKQVVEKYKSIKIINMKREIVVIQSLFYA